MEFDHPDLEEILGPTFGLMIYQEQLMRVSQKLAGYSLEEADNLRKATGKKIRELIAKERTKFVDGCVAQGHDRAFGERMFDIIEPFADYSFNKSHSVGYGFVAYQTAYLKANHPREYLAALLTSVKGDKDKSAIYLNECRQLDIPVLVPDVNESEMDFAVVHPLGADGEPGPGAIRFGLSAVRNVGEGVVAKIIEARDEGGPFTDFYDFCERVAAPVLNKRTIESLIKAGGFDSLGHPRQGLSFVFEPIIDVMIDRKNKEAEGQFDLFSTAEVEVVADGQSGHAPIPDQEFAKTQRLAFEKEMLGLYVSDHPLMGAERALRRHTDATLNDLKEMREGELRTVGGVVTALQKKYTKRGDLMATFVLEDLAAAVEVMVFPKTMAQFGEMLGEDAIICVRGRLDNRDDAPKVIAMEIVGARSSCSTARRRCGCGCARVRSPTPRRPASRRSSPSIPGESQVFVHLESHEKTTVVRLGDEFCVSDHNGLLAELRVLLGPDCLL